MKEIILLEDQPERLGSLIAQLQKQIYQNAVKIKSILCYDSSNKWDNDAFDRLRIKLKNYCNMDAIACEKVNIWNFEDVMDELYNLNNTGFIFDTQLFPGEDIEIFDYRINVRYALKKKNDGRIWFYTLAGQYYENNIRSRFKDYVISAEETEKGIILNLDDCASFQHWIHS